MKMLPGKANRPFDGLGIRLDSGRSSKHEET